MHRTVDQHLARLAALHPLPQRAWCVGRKLRVGAVDGVVVVFGGPRWDEKIVQSRVHRTGQDVWPLEHAQGCELWVREQRLGIAQYQGVAVEVQNLSKRRRQQGEQPETPRGGGHRLVARPAVRPPVPRARGLHHQSIHEAHRAALHQGGTSDTPTAQRGGGRDCLLRQACHSGAEGWGHGVCPYMPHLDGQGATQHAPQHRQCGERGVQV